MILKFRESFWSIDRNMRMVNKFLVREKKIPFTDSIRLRTDLQQNNGEAVWMHSSVSHTRTFTGAFDGLPMPQNYMEVFAYKQRKYIESIEGRPLWGLDIGVRYVSMEAPPSPCHINSLILSRMFKLTKRFKPKLEYNLLVNIILSGGPEGFAKSVSWFYKHWLWWAAEDARLLDYGNFNNDLQPIWEFWDTPERAGIERVVLDAYAHDTEMQAKVRRNFKWEMLAIIKNKRNEERAKKFNFFSFMGRILFFLSYYDKPYK